MRRLDWMAYSDIVRPRNAIASMASVRAAILSCYRPSVLVAGRSIASPFIPAGPLVDFVPLFRHLAVRHPLGISRFFRSRGLPDVLLVFALVGLFRPRGSAVRGCIDVDMRHNRLPRGRGDLNHTSSIPSSFSSGRVSATKIGWHRD